MRGVLFALLLLTVGASFAKTSDLCSKGTHVGPMHPHIRGAKGDTCPICGMKLSPDPACFSEEDESLSSDDKNPNAVKNSPCSKGGHVCPMHQHIRGDKGDTCPICGMKLSPDPACSSNEKDNVVSASIRQDGDVRINNKFQQQYGIKTVSAIKREFGRRIRAFGEVTISSRNTHNITMRSEGWVVDLISDAVGDDVKKGDLLFTFYSPDLMKAQADYLTGGGRNRAEEILKIQGMDDKAISEFKKKGDLIRNIPFYSPINGSVSILNVRQGSYIKSGELAITLQNYDEVWVDADVPIKDILFLSKGQDVDVVDPRTGRTYKSKIDYIHHSADPITRTGKVRIVLQHIDRDPKPGTFVDVIFSGKKEERLSVPEESILYSSSGTYVIEKVDEQWFRPIKVSLGITANGYSEITSGLIEGQEIVLSGQFIIDAESNLRNGFSAMSPSLN